MIKELVHRIVVWSNCFKKRPNVRRSAWIDKNAFVPKSCVVGERVKIKGFVIVGENCFVNDDVGIGSRVSIGNCCRIETKVIIGSCNSDGKGKIENLSPFPLNRCVAEEKDIPIKIGKWVAIEDGSIITKGVTIGNKALIMPGSVVSIDVPAFAIVEGNPAKVVGYRPEGK